MDEKTKVTLSAGELTIASDRDIILTKRIVMERASHLFSAQILFINNAFPQQIKEDLPVIGHPKISKGENYKGFPYVIMDYPALFSKDNVFALRTMFWWGSFFSITLHLSGKYKERYSEAIFQHLMHTGDDIYVCVEEKEWEHHFEESNYRTYSSLQPEEREALLQKSFLKVALKYELHHWNMMQSILPEGYIKIFNLLSA
jgi:hypothetical protein